MKRKIGLVAWSFGSAPLRDEPIACNKRLAEAVMEIVANEKDAEVLVVAQLEITPGITGIPVKTVGLPPHGVPNDSLWVMNEAGHFFRENGITEVIPVANQFLHLWSCTQLIRKAGFKPAPRMFKKIGFYPQSLTWWTRSPIHLLVYAVIQKFTGWRGDYRPS